MSEQDWALPKDEGREGLLRRRIIELRADNERLRALLARYQVANYAPEDSDLYEETRRALEGK